jgi:hemerythrin
MVIRVRECTSLVTERDVDSALMSKKGKSARGHRVIDKGHRDLAARLDEIVQLWRLGAETSILGERLLAFRDRAEQYFDQEICGLARSSDDVLLRHTAQHEEMIRKIEAVLADFSAGGGAIHWFNMIDSIDHFLRQHERPEDDGDIVLLVEHCKPPQESLVGWTHDLALGVDWIDQHHRALIDTINEIGMLPRHYDLADADALLERLRRITWHHFHEEEAHLAVGEHERALRHVAQHRHLLAELDRLIFDVRSRRVELTGLTGDRLCRWLIDHILTCDKQDFQSLMR